MSDKPFSRLPDPYAAFRGEDGSFRLADIPGSRLYDPALVPSAATGLGHRFGVDPFEVFKNLEDDSEIKRGLMSTIGAGARNLASIFEPFQLPQDLLFAAVAGLADPNSSFKDRFVGDEGFWRTMARYAPGGQAPARPASGSEILGLFGVENEQVKRWVGFGLDLGADPLLMGTWIKGIGLAARAGSAIGITDDTAKAIMRLGDSVDRAFSPLGVYKLVPNELRASMERNASEVFKRVVNAPVFWNRTESGSTYGDLFLSRRTALNQQFPKFVDDISQEVVDRAGGGARRMQFGDSIASAQSRARTAAADVQERAALLAGEGRNALTDPLKAEEVFGEAAKVFTPLEEQGFVQRGLELIGLKRLAGQGNRGLPTALRTYIEKNGATYMDEHGLMLMRAEDLTAPELKTLLEELPGQSKRFAKIRQAGQDDLDSYLDGVRSMARKTGVDPEVAAARARTYIQRLTEADALLGYHLSGTPFVRRKFFEAVLEKAGTDDKAVALTRDAWERAILVSNKGNADPLDVLTGIRKPSSPRPGVPENARLSLQTGGQGPFARAQGPQGPFERGGVPRAPDAAAIPGGLVGEGDSFYTIRELLEGNETFSALKLGDFLSGLTRGHLRRTYGVFQAGGNFQDWVKSVEKGKVFLSTVLDESLSGVSPSFAREAELVTGLLGDLRSSKRGTVLAKDTIFQHLMENGVDARRAREFMIDLVKAQNPHLAETLDRVQKYADMYSHRDASPSQAFGTFGRSFFSERNMDIDRADLEALGEFAQPLISISETGTAARVSLSFQQGIAEIYDLAKAHGYVVSQADNYIDPVSKIRYLPIPDSEVGSWGAFAGKQVHPFLKKEILQAMQNRGQRQVALERMRNLVTGGYLASPNVMTANAAGGLIQAAGIGLSPFRMIDSMRRTLIPLQRHDDGVQRFDVLETLGQYFDANESGIIGQNFVREFKNLEMTEAGLGPEGIRKFMGEFTNFVESQLQRPGVGNVRTRWLGLDGFQFIERWLKVSAFDAQKRKLMQVEGLAENVAEKLAAETARIAVFDYSELPQMLQTLRKTGVLMFPGFTYFMVPRMARAAMQRPGVISVSDRISDAVTSANVDEDERLALYASMPDWLRDEHGSVISKYMGADGEMRYVAIPMNQIVPTNTLAGNPWGESLATLGIYRPFQEAVTALIRGDGEAIFSGRYGQQVFDQGASKPQQALQTIEFLVSSLMPGQMRKLGLDPQSVRAALADPTQSPRGIVPRLFQTAFNVPKEVGELAYSISEVNRGRPDRQLRDEVLSFTLRAPQVLALGGPLASYGRSYRAAVQQYNAETEMLRKKMLAASLSGNQEVLARLSAQLQGRAQEFMDTWQPALEAVQRVQGRGSGESGALQGPATPGGVPGAQPSGPRGLPDPFGAFQER